MNSMIRTLLGSAAFALLTLNLGGCPVDRNTGDDLTASGSDPAPQTDAAQSGTTAPGGNAGGGQTGGQNPPPQPPPQTPPPPPPAISANAGPDQTVEDRALVTLSGRANDSSGQTISFEWTQVGGPAVVLAGANGATATFETGETSTTLQFRLTARSPSGEASDEVQITVRAAPILFVVNRTGSIVSFRKPAALAGDLSPRTIITGDNALLTNPSDVILDAGGSLIAANPEDNRLNGYLNGLNASGIVTPNRLVNGTETQFNGPEALAYDAGRDLLYVGNYDGIPGFVCVFENVSRPVFSGRIAPARRINSYGMMNVRAMRLMPDGTLYVGSSGNHVVAVFPNAAGLTGQVTPARTIWRQNSSSLSDFELDAANRLYLLDRNERRLFVYEGAATLDGEQTGGRQLNLVGATDPACVVVDRDGVGYVSDAGANAILVIRDIGTKSGDVTADATISGPRTGISYPDHLRLIQR